ncbi:MAG: potassium-transporting ATPase subunit KdpC [Chlamydiia bacterium]|nr:potassium-transporting ATPase subunit KdpC [Chlamydiia bacterium]
MKKIVQTISTAFFLFILLGILLGGIYPLISFGIAKVITPNKAKGSLIYKGDRVIGSELIGQNFQDVGYFHSRPSACDYDGIKSAGSNLGPTSNKLHENLEKNVNAYRKINGIDTQTLVPADAVTSSGSGLDPHISIKNARIQASRVALAQNLPLQTVFDLIEQFTEKKTLGIFGRERINVLKLNLAVQQASKENSKRK